MAPRYEARETRKILTNTFAPEPSLKKITFKRLPESTNEIYKNLKILRYSDSVFMQNCLFMNQIEQNEKITKSLSKLKYCGDNQITDHMRSATRKHHCIKYHCIIDWNNF